MTEKLKVAPLSEYILSGRDWLEVEITVLSLAYFFPRLVLRASPDSLRRGKSFFGSSFFHS